MTSGKESAPLEPGRLHRAVEAEWNDRAPGLWGYGVQQTWSYGAALAARRGAVSEPVWIRRGDRVLGAADVRVKPLPIIGGGLAYVSQGPLLALPPSDPAFPETWGAAIRALGEEYCRRRRCILRIAPPLGAVDAAADVERELLGAGFRANPDTTRYRTLRLDLAPDPDRLRAGLAKKWRNQLRSAEKQGLAITATQDRDSLARFSRLFEEFVARKDFTVDLGPEFYETVQGGLAPGDRLVTQFAEREGRIVAGHVSSMLGDTCVYLLGATSADGLETRAAYLLQWNTILLAKERGMRWYDLGGIDPEGNPGVHHFKRGVGGEEVVSPGPFERSPGGWRQVAVRGAEAVYRLARRGSAPAKPPPARTPGTSAGEDGETS